MPVTLTGTIHRIFEQWIKALVNAVPERLRATDIKTAAYTASLWDLVLVDPTGGEFDISLPLIEGKDHGGMIAFKNITTSTVPMTLAPAIGNTIDTAASRSLRGSRVWVLLVADANRKEWQVFS